MNDNFFIDTDGLEQIGDYEEFLVDDPNIGFFYTDFVKHIPHYHTEFPSVITDYPVIIFPKEKYEESKDHPEPMKYLSEKYVAVHIPVVAYRVKE